MINTDIVTNEVLKAFGTKAKKIMTPLQAWQNDSNYSYIIIHTDIAFLTGWKINARIEGLTLSGDDLFAEINAEYENSTAIGSLTTIDKLGILGALFYAIDNKLTICVVCENVPEHILVYLVNITDDLSGDKVPSINAATSLEFVLEEPDLDSDFILINDVFDAKHDEFGEFVCLADVASTSFSVVEQSNLYGVPSVIKTYPTTTQFNKIDLANKLLHTVSFTVPNTSKLEMGSTCSTDFFSQTLEMPLDIKDSLSGFDNDWYTKVKFNSKGLITDYGRIGLATTQASGLVQCGYTETSGSLNKAINIDTDGNLYVDLSGIVSDIHRYDVMPTAANTYSGDIVEYIGNTTLTYTNGYFYKCVPDYSNYAESDFIKADITHPTQIFFSCSDRAKTLLNLTKYFADKSWEGVAGAIEFVGSLVPATTGFYITLDGSDFKLYNISNENLYYIISQLDLKTTIGIEPLSQLYTDFKTPVVFNNAVSGVLKYIWVLKDVLPQSGVSLKLGSTTIDPVGNVISLAVDGNYSASNPLVTLSSIKNGLNFKGEVNADTTNKATVTQGAVASQLHVVIGSSEESNYFLENSRIYKIEWDGDLYTYNLQSDPTYYQFICGTNYIYATSKYPIIGDSVYLYDLGTGTYVLQTDPISDTIVTSTNNPGDFYIFNYDGYYFEYNSEIIVPGTTDIDASKCHTVSAGDMLYYYEDTNHNMKVCVIEKSNEAITDVEINSIMQF